MKVNFLSATPNGLPFGKAWTYVGALLCCMASVGKAQQLPKVMGEMSEQIAPADVNAMCALAQGLVGVPLREPMLIRTEASSARDQPAQLWRAVVYFTPRELTPNAWRGFSLDCYREDSLYPQDDQTRRKIVGKWSVPIANEIGEYLVLPPPGGKLPDLPTDQFTRLHSFRLASGLETRRLVELVDAAHGYSRMLPDGSELPFGDLPIQAVHTKQDKDGRMTGTVDVSPPRGQLRRNFPFHVHLIEVKSGEWRIESVDQWVY